MRLEVQGTTRDILLPNPDFGYETTVQLPFHFSTLGTGKVSAFDEGARYDRYSVKCSTVMSIEALDHFFSLYNNDRGVVWTLTECLSTGFFPFTPSVRSSFESMSDLDKFTVTLGAIDNRGMVDMRGKGFRVNFDMYLSQITWWHGWQNAQPEGSMTMRTSGGLITINGIRYPIRGFAPTTGYNVYVRQKLGGAVDVVNYEFFRRHPINEPRRSSFTITANEAAATNIIRTIVWDRDIRANVFELQVPEHYHPFGRNDDGVFHVRITSPELKVRHTRFDEFEINLNLAEA